jgi:hypothetical protein
MYRSKDKDFMEHIKKEVLQVTKGLDKEDRKFAIDYLRTHVKIDDLYLYARKKFPGKTLEFGNGSFQPKVVVLTKDPISNEHREKLDIAWRKLNLMDDDIYYAHLRFVKTKKKQEIRKDIIEKLIDMLQPELTVIFDDVEVSVSGKCYEVKESISILTDSEQKDARKELTGRLRNFKKQSVI